MPDRRPGLVNLAKVFQPSLQLLVMHLTRKYRINDNQWRSEWNVSDRPRCSRKQSTDMLSQPIIGKNDPAWSRPHVPEKYFFFGMNYSQTECIIYTFFPCYEVTSSGQVEWGFCCYEAYDPWTTDGIDPLHRVHLVNTFHRIQCYTAELAKIFLDVSFSLGDTRHV